MEKLDQYRKQNCSSESGKSYMQSLNATDCSLWVPPILLLLILNEHWCFKPCHNHFSSVAQSCPTLFNPVNSSTPGLPVHHQLPESTQTHTHRVGDAIQPSHPLSSRSPPAPNPSQHQGLFQWVNFSHEVAKVLEFQLQHQSFQRTPRLISFRMDWLDLLAVQGTLKSLL